MSSTAYKHNRVVQYTCEMENHDQQIHKQQNYNNFYYYHYTSRFWPANPQSNNCSNTYHLEPTIVITPPTWVQQLQKPRTLSVPMIIITPPKCDQQILEQVISPVPTIVITPPKCDQQIHKQIILVVTLLLLRCSHNININ